MNADIPVINLLANGEAGLYAGGSGMGVARVFPGDLPQSENFPMICVDLFDAEAFDTKSGTAWSDDEIVKVFNYDEDVLGVKTMAKASRNTLDGVSRTTAGGETVYYIRYLRTDSYSILMTNRKVYVREQDYQVRIKV